MSASHSPVRIDRDITQAARAVAEGMSRSVAQQISHWARIGREIERSPELSVVDIQRVLSGQAEYDALGPKEQAVVRAEWAERMQALRGELRLNQLFRDQGYAYAELNAAGEVVVRRPRARPRKAG